MTLEEIEALVPKHTSSRLAIEATDVGGGNVQVELLHPSGFRAGAVLTAEMIAKGPPFVERVIRAMADTLYRTALGTLIGEVKKAPPS